MRIVLLIAIATLGCGRPANRIPSDTLNALNAAESLELFSLDPWPPEKKDESSLFNGWTILGSVKLEEQSQRKEIVESLLKGVAENKGELAACFKPRHGIRVNYKNHKHDIVICFECMQLTTFVNGVEGKGALVTSSPKSTFDRVLHASSVPLSKE